MSGPKSLIGDVASGEPLRWKSLTVHPLVATGARGSPGYVLLEQAVSQGTVRISEVAPAGSLPEVLVTNLADIPVLILQGEELAGARQNRCVNVTVLVPPQSSSVLPVCCVEQGRWFRSSEYFSLPGNLLFPDARASCVEAVSNCLLRTGARRADQADLWHRIGEKSRRLQSSSSTRALSGIYSAALPDLDEFARRLQPRPGQVGAVFEIGSRIAGMDLFWHPATYSAFARRLISSYALEAVECETLVARRDMGRPVKFLSSVDRALRTYIPAVGLGTECRLSGRFIQGEALLLQGQTIHLCAFRSVGASWGTTSMHPQLRRAGQAAAVSPRPLQGKRAPRDSAPFARGKPAG